MSKNKAYYIIFLFISFFSSVAYGGSYHYQCDASDTENFYTFDETDLMVGNITRTEISIYGKNKKICTTGYAVTLDEMSDYVSIGFDMGLRCHQKRDDLRIEASKLRSKGYFKIVGKFGYISWLEEIVLEDCEISKTTG